MLIRMVAGWLLPLFIVFQDSAKEPTKAVPFTVKISGEEAPKTIQGKILVPDGCSVDTLVISSGWFWDPDRKTTYRPWDEGPQEVRNGRIETRFNRDADALFAFDEKNRMGAVQVLKGRPPDGEITLDLKPLVEVQGELVCKNLTPSWAKAEVYAMSTDGREAPVAAYYFENGKGREVRLLLPPGKYQVLFKGTSAQHRVVPLTIDGKDRIQDMKRIELSPRSIEGGLIPETWKVTAARGVAKDLKLSDYRGKWVLLEFWGWW
jgi:hypothetical protein